MINEADPAFHAWATLDSELRRRSVTGWILALPNDPESVFLAASLLPAFRAVHGKASARVNVVVDRTLAGLPDLFPGAADLTLAHPALDAGLLDSLALFSRFRPGDVFVADPQRHGDGRLPAFLGCGGIEPLDLWRYVLHLPWGVEPVPPAPSAERRAAAAARFAATGLPAGRTCVLNGLTEADAAVAASLASNGWALCVVRTPSDPAAAVFPGAVAVEADWSEIIPFCETAGAVVAAADGRNAVLKHAACRRAFVHADADALKRRVTTPPWAAPGEPADILAGAASASAVARALAQPA